MIFRNKCNIQVFLILSLTIFLPLCSDKKSDIILEEPNKVLTKELVADITSNYSHIKIYNEGSRRFLCFVRDNGDEVVESSIDLIHPEYLQLKYTQAMFAGLLLNKKLPLKTLLVGLGGAGMPHFSSHYFPEIEMKIVEIDPEIIKIAKNHFMITEKISKNIINDDVYTYFTKVKELYEIIFMDAFLKPSKTTDETGISYKLKEKTFYNSLKNHLTKNGLVVFNINQHINFQKDILSIQENFESIYIVNRKSSGNYIVIASMNPEKISEKDMQSMAQWIDLDRSPNYSFRELLKDFKEVEALLK
jgi:spermidine synthase